MGQYHRLDVEFYSPAVYYEPPTLDGLVCCAAGIERHKGELILLKPRQPNKFSAGIEALDGLIDLVEDVPLASTLRAYAILDYLDSWKKRFESRYVNLCNFGKGRRRISYGSGKYRAHDVPLPAHVIRGGYFLFKGNGPAVVKLLEQNVIGLGKKVREGFGWIRRITLSDEPTLEDADILKLRPLRPEIASRYGIKGKRVIGAYKPPYWAPENQVECIMPC